jgi:hypothetical protein
MFPVRTTLLVLTLGLVAWMGWVRSSLRPVGDLAASQPAIDRSPMDPHTHSHLPHPARRGSTPDPASDDGTRPDPTPNDEGQPPVVKPDEPDPVSVVPDSPNLDVTCCLIASPVLSWSDCWEYALLFRITSRIRC